MDGPSVFISIIIFIYTTTHKRTRTLLFGQIIIWYSVKINDYNFVLGFDLFFNVITCKNV